MTQVDLSLWAHVSGREDIFITGVQDIVIDTTLAQPTVYAGTGSGGAGLSVWNIGQTQSVRVDVASYPGEVRLGARTELHLIEINGQASLVATGINEAGI